MSLIIPNVATFSQNLTIPAETFETAAEINEELKGTQFDSAFLRLLINRFSSSFL